MVLRCFGSSSSGNCYMLTSAAGESLMIECGISLRHVARSCGIAWPTVCGCLVSHKHQDHSKYSARLMGYGVTVYTNKQTLDSIDSIYKSVKGVQMREREWAKIGTYEAMPLAMEHCDHDGSNCECWAFVVSHPELGKLLFATDTAVFRYKMRGLRHIMIEANYSDEILQYNIDKGLEDVGKRNRLMLSHLELGTTIRTLQGLDLSEVQEVVLLHLSGGNSDPVEFKEAVERAIGKPCYVATEGLIIQMTKEPY